MTQQESRDLGDFVCEVLHGVYVANRATFQWMAKSAGVPVESLAAAAVSQALTETYRIQRRGLPDARPRAN